MNVVDRLRPREGLRVLVTAGASGIGAAIADAFLGAGARVHICDNDAAALAAFVDARAGLSGTVANVSDEAQMVDLFAALTAELGGLDILVNNAGIAGPTGAIDEIRLADWRHTIEVNLTGQYLAAHHAVPLLRQSDDAAIVNISSAAGRFGYALRTPYASAKWGVVGLSASLAKELGPAGIRVNAILPGIVDGERMRKVIADRAATMDLSYAEVEKRYLQTISLRRMVDPEDVAAMTLFLCSPGGHNVSGQAIGVCGNVEAL
jgi:NAD(P)-dependent dehydrogenase (short-subunit alcohol dehydrogenase family)